jgi:hypothetical protein
VPIPGILFEIDLSGLLEDHSESDPGLVRTAPFRMLKYHESVTVA